MADNDGTPRRRRGGLRWIAWTAGLCGFTVAMLALARLLGWLSRAQIDYLAN